MSLQVGDRFGFLTILQTGIPGKAKAGSMALCRCDCGTERLITARHIQYGNYKSCGCVAKSVGELDGPKYAYHRAYLGRKVGHWTVIGLVPRPLRTRQKLRCRCVCGRERELLAYKLDGNRTRSCGCRGKRKPT